MMNFSVAVDDHLMGMSHVLRGKDHLANSEKQKYLYDHMGWDVPEFIHYGRLKMEDIALSTSKALEGISSGKYSGWDDPVKTVADVFLQPEKPADWKFLSPFCERLHMWRGLEKRVRVWMPFFAAKWAVILLGPMAKDAARRRRFAGEVTDEAAVERQIGKAHKVIQRGNEFLQ